MCGMVVRGNGAGNDLPDGQFQFFWQFLAVFTADAFCQHRPDFLKESDFITNLQSRVMQMAASRKRVAALDD